MKSFNRILLFIVATTLFFQSCNKDNDGSIDNQILNESLENALVTASGGVGKSHFVLPASTDYSSIPQDPKNPINASKIELGRLLYHETGMAVNPKHSSSQGTYSCASCHSAAAGFQAGRKQGIGDGGIGYGQKGEGRDIDPNYAITEVDVQPIRTPSALNSAYQEVMLWNGQFGATGPNVGTSSQWIGIPKETNHRGYHGLETQAIAGVGVHRMRCDEAMIDAAGYKPYFDDAFPDEPIAERYNNETGGLAIAAYERTLLANRAPFQRWLQGETDAISAKQKRGAILFFGKAECYNCHSGPALNSMGFHSLGMADLDGPGIYGNGVDDATSLGRGGFTGNPIDNFKFKVPQLYNLKDSPFYGHGGSFTSIEAVVRYKNRALSEKTIVHNLDPKFSPLGLNDEEISELADFLAEALYDPNLKRYEPDALLSGLCFPNNDAVSREDLGCN